MHFILLNHSREYNHLNDLNRLWLIMQFVQFDRFNQLCLIVEFVQLDL